MPVFFLAALIFTVLCDKPAFSQRAESENPDLLFLAHFNESVQPEVGGAEGMVIQAEISGGGQGYPFDDSTPRAEALNAGRKNAFLAYPAKGNFSTAAGSLQMLVKPQWRLDSYGHCVFFKLVFEKHTHKGSFGGVNSFYLQKSPRQQRIALVQNGNLRNGGIKAEIPDTVNGWLHLTATWDLASEQYCLYINGEPSGSNRFRAMTAEPLEFTLGSPGTHNAQALIDEVRILKRALDAEEVKRDYKHLMAGKEFESAGGERGSAPAFAPMPLEKSESGFAAQLLPETFAAPFTSAEIVLDGIIDEPEWMALAPITALGSRHEKREMPPPTEIRLLHNKQNLLISAVLHTPDMENHLARYDQNDQAIFNDECLEFFLDLDGSNEEFYQFIVNSLGALYDSKAGNARWNGRGIKVATKRHEASWSVEMQIPFAALNRPSPLPGEFWGLRLGREHHHGTPPVSIPIVQSGSFNQRHYMGKLLFSAGEGQGDRIVECDQKEFLLGINMLKLQLSGEWPEKLLLHCSLFDDDNQLIEKQLDSFGFDTLLQLPLKISDDRISRAVLQIQNEKGDTLHTLLLERGFPFVSPGLSELHKETRSLLQSMQGLWSLRHPVYEAAHKSLLHMKQSTERFQEEVRQAIRQKETVPLPLTEGIFALANGFQHYKNDNLYLFWEVTPWEYGNPAALPAKDYGFCREIQYFQAGNEREAKAFVLSGLLCGSRLDLRIVPRSSNKPGKPFLSNCNFEVYSEPFINHLGDQLTGPLIQAPGNIVTVTPGQAQRIWIVFNSRGVEPGLYETSIDIKPLNDFSLPTQTVAVNLQVWNFTLPETRDWPMDAFFWGPNRLDNDEVEMLKLMHSRHVKWGWTKSVLYTRGIERKNKAGKLPEGQLFDPELLLNANEEFFQTAKKLGMKFVFGWGTCNSVEWHQLMADRLKKIGFSTDDFIFKGLIRDEFVKADIYKNAELRQKVAELHEDWVFQAVYLSTPPPSGATLEDIEEAKLTDFYKNWAVISGLLTRAPEEGRRIAEFFKRQGCAVWPYRCNTSMITLSILEYYRFLPWLAYSMKLPGFAFWTCLGGTGGDDGFDYRDGNDDGITWRDGQERPIPSKQLEAVCEGLEDVAYMTALQDALEQAGNNLPLTRRQSLQALISTRLTEIMDNCSQNEVNAWRHEVGTAIHELNKP